MKVEATFHGDRKVFGVSAFNQGIGIYLRRLPSLWVEGEVTDLRRNEAWAFVFFTLKDPDTGACVRATMPRRRFDELALELSDGERVLVEGKAEIYEAKGELSFRATTIERVGLGDHLAAIERLKRVLAAEGLFAAERKRPLPRFPRAVGVVTGADAAARGDVIASIQARFPAAHIVIAETRVQGASAGARIAATLGRVAAHPAVDVVIVTRGGGSFEDLLPFSDEAVVRAFARCPVPVVSAVGHEQDTPLCDLAADVRASTPTAAARLVVPDLGELSAGLVRLRDQLDGSVTARPRPRPRAPRARPPATPRRPGAAARAPARRARPCRRPAAGALASRNPRARLRRRPLRWLGAQGCGHGRSRQPPRDRAGDGRPRRDRGGGARVSNGEAVERTFEDLRRELEEIVGRLERGDVAVDEAIELWQRGEALHRRCAALLEAAEGRIEELSAGGPMTGKRPGCKVTAMSQPTADLIRGVPLFADLDDKTVERLAGEFIERHFDEGAAIATEGTDGLNFFIVASGEAAVTIHGEQVGTLGPGNSFGEVALVDKSARSATVTATTPMVAYALPVWSFRPFVEQRPELAWKLLEVLAERLRAANAR